MVREKAPAKVNLFLHVVGRRADGYHRLESLVMFADVGDEIEIAAADALSLTITGPFAGRLQGESDNLVLRAAKMLAAHVGREPRIAIRLIKRLPVGAGLGGGSADAAATLRALCHFWNLTLSPEKMHQIAITLGADVAVCLDDQVALVKGIGEDITPLDFGRRLPAILVFPGQSLLTKAVFAARQGSFSIPLDWAAVDVEAALRELGGTRNDLTAAAQALCPTIIQVIDTMNKYEKCRHVRMSGSGSACFALVEGIDEAHRISRAISATFPHWWVIPTTLGTVRKGLNPAKD